MTDCVSAERLILTAHWSVNWPAGYLKRVAAGRFFYFAAQQSIDSVNDDSVRAVTNDFVASPSVSTPPTADYAFCRRFLFAQKYYLTISVGSIT